MDKKINSILEDETLKELYEKCKPVYEWLKEKYTFVHEVVINCDGATLKTNTAFLPESYLAK